MTLHCMLCCVYNCHEKGLCRTATKEGIEHVIIMYLVNYYMKLEVLYIIGTQNSLSYYS